MKRMWWLAVCCVTDEVNECNRKLCDWAVYVGLVGHLGNSWWWFHLSEGYLRMWFGILSPLEFDFVKCKNTQHMACFFLTTEETYIDIQTLQRPSCVDLMNYFPFSQCLWLMLKRSWFCFFNFILSWQFDLIDYWLALTPGLSFSFSWIIHLAKVLRSFLCNLSWMCLK